MIIGIPKEIKTEEYRVGLMPEGVMSIVAEKGNKVIVEKDAGAGAGFQDSDYEKAGAEIVSGLEEIYKKAELIIKVKEPQERELSLIRENQILFTFFHFSSNKKMTERLIERKATCVAYELVEENGTLPILKPMSEIAGKLSIQQGMKYLEKEYGGKGILLSGAEGVKKGKVVIIGGGTVGFNAAKIASGIGAEVTILEIDHQKMQFLKENFKNAEILLSNEDNLMTSLKSADVIVGAVLIPGKKTPVLVKKEHLKIMEEGTVLVDVAIDEGGVFETSHPTTPREPVYIQEGIIHYCVANTPGIVPRTSTYALCNASFPYVKILAEKGEKAFEENLPLKKGLAIFKGESSW